MKMRFAAALLALLWVITPGASFRSCGNAQQPDPGKYSSAEHELVEFRNQMVPMRDGVKLAVDIFRPEGEGRFPVVLSQIPYDKNGGGGRARWQLYRRRCHRDRQFPIFKMDASLAGAIRSQDNYRQGWDVG